MSTRLKYTEENLKKYGGEEYYPVFVLECEKCQAKMLDIQDYNFCPYCGEEVDFVDDVAIANFYNDTGIFDETMTYKEFFARRREEWEKMKKRNMEKA